MRSTSPDAMCAGTNAALVAPHKEFGRAAIALRNTVSEHASARYAFTTVATGVSAGSWVYVSDHWGSSFIFMIRRAYAVR